MSQETYARNILLETLAVLIDVSMIQLCSPRFFECFLDNCVMHILWTASCPKG